MPPLALALTEVAQHRLELIELFVQLVEAAIEPRFVLLAFVGCGGVLEMGGTRASSITKDATIRPATDLGVTSPYPTVVTVWIAHHIPMKMFAYSL